MKAREDMVYSGGRQKDEDVDVEERWEEQGSRAMINEREHLIRALHLNALYFGHCPLFPHFSRYPKDVTITVINATVIAHPLTRRIPLSPTSLPVPARRHAGRPATASATTVRSRARNGCMPSIWSMRTMSTRSAGPTLLPAIRQPPTYPLPTVFLPSSDGRWISSNRQRRRDSRRDASMGSMRESSEQGACRLLGVRDV